MRGRLQREVAADERGDGLLVVNGGDGLSELLGDRDSLDLAADLDGDGVGDDALDDGGIVQALDGRTGEDAVGGADVDVAGAHSLELLDVGAQGASGVDHVVVDDAGLALDVTDDAHDLGGVVARTALVGDGQVAAEHVGQLLGGLGATHVGGDDNQVVGVEVHVVVVLAKQRQCGQVVNRDIEEALDLALVQVEGDDAVDAGTLEQVGDEAGGDGLARAGLAVLAGIAVVGDNGGDGAGGCALGSVGGDEQLHEHVVDVAAGHGLNQEDVGAADGLVVAGVNLTVGELL